MKQHTWLLGTNNGPVHPTPIVSHKIHASSVHVIFAALFLQHPIYTNYFPPKVKSPWSTHWVSPSSHITYQVHPGTWAKTVPLMDLPFPLGREIHPNFPSHFPCIGWGPYLPVCRGFVWAGPGWLADPLVLISQVAAAVFVSQCFLAPLPNTVFSSLIPHNLSRGWCVTRDVTSTHCHVFLPKCLWGYFEIESHCLILFWGTLLSQNVS